MIANMHIRREYREWIEWPKKRVTTLCGKTTTPKSAGIPVITEGQCAAVISDADYGWCIKCCVVFLKDNPDEFIHSIMDSRLFDLYYAAALLCKQQIKLMLDSLDTNVD